MQEQLAASPLSVHSALIPQGLGLHGWITSIGRAVAKTNIIVGTGKIGCTAYHGRLVSVNKNKKKNKVVQCSGMYVQEVLSIFYSETDKVSLTYSIMNIP